MVRHARADRPVRSPQASNDFRAREGIGDEEVEVGEHARPARVERGHFWALEHEHRPVIRIAGASQYGRGNEVRYLRGPLFL